MIEQFNRDVNGVFVKNSDLNVSFPSDGHKNLIDIENNSFWFSHRNAVLMKVIERFPFAGDFVDIGGGNGYQIKNISRHNTKNKNILIEPGYLGCLTAKKRGVELVYNSLFEDFDFSEYSIRGVALLDVVEHIKKDEEFLTNLLLKLKVGTRLYITLPAHNYLWSDVDPYGGHFRRYNKKMVQKLANKLDVEFEYFTYFFSYLYPISFLLRALPYKLGIRKTDDQLLEDEKNQHNPSGLISKIFNYMENWELKKLSKSSVAVGASCFLVLKKC